MWSDRDDNLILTQFETINAKDLIWWYNLSLFQTLLFKCTQLEFYVKGGLYFKAVKAFKEAFTNVKVIIFEEFIKNSQKSVNEVLDFLEIEHKHEFSMDRFNKSGRPKNRIVNKFLTRKSWLKSLLKRILGENVLRILGER